MFMQFDDWRSWASECAQWLDAHFDIEVLNRFNEFVEPNWIEWLDREQSTISTPTSSVDVFRRHIETKFEGVRLFHVTKLPHTESVRSDGLRAWSPEELRKLAKETFPTAQPDELERAIRLSSPDHRGGRVYTFLLQRDARSACGLGFATHGSEWLHAVAVRLGNGFVEGLRTNNDAYLVTLDVPWTMLESSTRLNLARHALLTTVTLRFFNVDGYSCPAPKDECVSLDRDVPPECVARIDRLCVPIGA